jgi:hypothetical protein
MTQTPDDRAQEARDVLSPGDEKLNELWREAEEEITKCRISHGVQNVYRCSEAAFINDSKSQWQDSLGIQRFNGTWRICHRTDGVMLLSTSCSAPPSERGWTPIADCSPEVRARAARHLAGLLQELDEETAESVCPTVDEAIGFLSRALETARARHRQPTAASRSASE